MPRFHFNTRRIINHSFATALMLVSVFTFAFLVDVRPVSAEPSESGISGFVTDTNDDPVEGVSIQFSCKDELDYWPEFAQTDSSGEYERLGIYDGNLGCEGGIGDGEVIKIRATKDGYLPSEEVSLVTIDYAAAGAENLVEWTDWYFGTMRTQSFVIEKLPPGWSGEVSDDDTGDPLEGATFSLTCEGQSGIYNFPGVSSDADGLYAISKAQFVTAMNFIGCYYNSDPFLVSVTASFEGYLDDTIAVYDVDPGDAGEAFDIAVTRDYYLMEDPALNYAEGDGTQADPFIIDSIERFESISEFGDGGQELYFALDADLVFTGDEGSFSFKGSFDGREHSITGITKGLFSQLEDATVENLHVDGDLDYPNPQSGAGILADEARNGTYIANVHTSGSISAICSNQCYDFGGLVGELNSASRIHQSSSAATVMGTGTDAYYFGGLVGSVNNSAITESYATGNVGAGSNIGGLVGSLSSGASSYIRDSYATGDVNATGPSYSAGGGLAGSSSGPILRSYSTGSVTVESLYGGGFVGSMLGGSIVNSFSASASVTGDSETGGFIGTYEDGEILNSAWITLADTYAIGSIIVDNPILCQSGPTGLLDGVTPCDFGTDLTSASQLTKNGYNGGLAPIYLDAEDSWDFETIWGFNDNVNGGLPYLRWSVEDSELQPEPESEEEPEYTSSRGRSGGSRRSVTQSTTPAATQTSAVTASSFTRNLDVGVTGSDVKELQKFLNGRGFTVAQTGPGSVGNETDMFGNATKAALAKFQTANGIVPAAGYFGPVTRAFIANIGVIVPTVAPATTPTEASAIPQIVRDLDMGMSGDDVRALQTLLMAQGYSIPAGATGYFATQTRDALAAYQAKNGISPAIGYFGEKTRTQMKFAGLSGLWW